MIAEFWDYHKGVENITTTYKGNEVTFQNVCAHVYDGSPCVVTTVLDYWSSKEAIYSDPSTNYKI
jgi:hypothetical protein